jgi:hypothetical protein
MVERVRRVLAVTGQSTGKGGRRRQTTFVNKVSESSVDTRINVDVYLLWYWPSG